MYNFVGTQTEQRCGMTQNNKTTNKLKQKYFSKQPLYPSSLYYYLTSMTDGYFIPFIVIFNFKVRPFNAILMLKRFQHNLPKQGSCT